jgi:hypothetical protein
MNMATQAIPQTATPTAQSKVVWGSTQKGTNWDTTEVKKSANDVVDAVVPKMGACAGAVLKAAVAKGAPVVVDYLIKPIATSCIGAEIPEGAKPFMDVCTATAVVETISPTIDACVKSSTDCAQSVLKRSSNTCIDNTASCAQRIVSSWQ